MAEQNQSGATNTASPTTDNTKNNSTSIVPINNSNSHITTTENDNNSKSNTTITPLATLPPFRRVIAYSPPRLRTVDEYEKQGMIGKGTYGKVYKARCRRTDKLVALKLIRIKDFEDGVNFFYSFHIPTPPPSLLSILNNQIFKYLQK